MRSRLAIPTIAAAGIAIVAALLTAACDIPEPVPSSLPLGMDEARVPPVDTNAYVYVRTPNGLTFTRTALGVEGLLVESAQVLLMTVRDEYAVLLRPAAADPGPVPDNPGGWSAWDRRGLRLGPNSPWGILVREAWDQGALRPFAEKFAAEWVLLQALPANPPATPIAAGFVRNFGDLIELLAGQVGTSVPGLANGLTLMRVSRIVFAAYSDTLSTLPESVGEGVLADLDASVLAVARSSYPGAVVGRAYEGFTSALGLAAIDVAGATAYHRALGADMHVVMLREGSLIFFAIGATQADAEALIAAVVRDQRGAN